MFSAKVIAMIHILSKLEPLINTQEGMSRRKCVVSINEFTADSMISRYVVKSVLMTMLRCKWIDKNHRGYYLLIEPSSITLYDMYIELHEGIPIGESVVGSSMCNLYRHSDKWSKVAQIEDEIMQYLTCVLSNTRFADIRTCVEG